LRPSGDSQASVWERLEGRNHGPSSNRAGVCKGGTTSGPTIMMVRGGSCPSEKTRATEAKQRGGDNKTCAGK